MGEMEGCVVTTLENNTCGGPAEHPHKPPWLPCPQASDIVLHNSCTECPHLAQGAGLVPLQLLNMHLLGIVQLIFGNVSFGVDFAFSKGNPPTPK